MLDNFFRWYNSYYTEITWFIIGFLTMDVLQQFSRGNWVGMLISIVLIVLNYQFIKRR
jgi:hypothetical protein